MTPRLVSLLAAVMALASSRDAVAQGDGSPRGLIAGAGASWMEFDQNGEQVSRALVLRAGAAPVWFADITAVAQFWPHLGVYRGGSLVLEGTFYPAGRPTIAPFILLGVGYFDARDRTGQGFDALSGITKTFGVGVTGRLGASWGLRLDGSVRFDPGSFDDELRLAVVTSPRLSRPSGLRAGSAQGAFYALEPWTGPWRAVEPGIGLAFTTPLAPRTDATVDVLLLHWHTVGNASFTGWDTRAVVALPGVAWVMGPASARFRVGGGLAGTLMFEGPDDGLRGGMHVDLGATFDLGGGFLGSAAASLLWLVRSERPDLVSASQLSSTDERALLLRFGLGR